MQSVLVFYKTWSLAKYYSYFTQRKTCEESYRFYHENTQAYKTNLTLDLIHQYKKDERCNIKIEVQAGYEKILTFSHPKKCLQCSLYNLKHKYS